MIPTKSAPKCCEKRLALPSSIADCDKRIWRYLYLCSKEMIEVCVVVSFLTKVSFPCFQCR